MSNASRAENLDGDEKSGRPPASTNDPSFVQAKDINRANRQWTVRGCRRRDWNIHWSMSRNFNRWSRDASGLSDVARRLSTEIGNSTCFTWLRSLATTNVDDFFKTSSEMSLWFMGMKQNMSSQCKNPGSLCPRKARQVPTKVSVLILLYSGYRGIVDEFIPADQTVTQAYYLEVLRRVRDAVRRIRPAMWTAGTCHLSWQCTSSYRVVESRVVGKVFDSCPSKTSVFAWPIPSWPLQFLQVKIGLKLRFRMVEDIITNARD
jgi:hypothetical protein